PLIYCLPSRTRNCVLRSAPQFANACVDRAVNAARAPSASRMLIVLLIFIFLLLLYCFSKGCAAKSPYTHTGEKRERNRSTDNSAHWKRASTRPHILRLAHAGRDRGDSCRAVWCASR